MPSTSDASRGFDSSNAAIADRLNSRLALVAKAFDRRHGATRPKRGTVSSRTLASLQDESLSDQRELTSLRTVFTELGEAHRRYRTQTGQAGTPELRAAAHAFKEAPSRTSLLPVATLIDSLQILAW